MSTPPAIAKLGLSIRSKAIAQAVTAGAKARLRKVVSAVGSVQDAVLETKLAKNIMRRAGALRMPPGAEATSLVPEGGLALRLAALRRLIPTSAALDRCGVVVARLARMKKGYVTLIERIPTDEWVDFITDFRAKFLAAAAKDRPEITKRFTARLNEILGIFHPEVIEELNGRARSALKVLQRNPKFMEGFEVASEEAKVLRFVRRAGADPSRSHLPTLESVDGLGVLVLRHRKTGEAAYLMLGDIQVKSSNVLSLVIRDDGRPGQLINDAVRKARGTDIALTSFEGKTIAFESLIDPGRFGARSHDLQPIAVGQRRLTRGERADLRMWGITAKDFQHDASTAKIEAIVRAIARAKFGDR